MSTRKERIAKRDAKTRAWIDTKYKREKITADDIIARREAKKIAKQEIRENREQPRYKRYVTWRNFIALLGFGGAIAFAVAGQGTLDAYETQFAENEAVIEELENHPWLTANQEEVDTKEVLQVAAMTIDDAEKAAKKVAELQNQYAGLNVYVAQNEDGIAEVVGAQEIENLTSSIGEYFVGLSFSGVTQNWFSMYNKVDGDWVKAPVGSFEWIAGDSWTMTGPRSARIVWEARETSTGDLLAWAVGNWNQDEKAFDGLTIGMTSFGAAYQPATDSGLEDDNSLFPEDSFDLDEFLNTYRESDVQ